MPEHWGLSCADDSAKEKNAELPCSRAVKSSAECDSNDSWTRTGTTDLGDIPGTVSEHASEGGFSSGDEGSSDTEVLNISPWQDASHVFAWPIESPRVTDLRSLDASRYQCVEVVRKSSRRRPCQIELHRDSVSGLNVIVKRFRANWIFQSFQEYLTSGGSQLGNPWKEIMYSEWLKQHSKRPQIMAAGTTAFHEASTGDALLICPIVPDCDLFEKCKKLGSPGPEREANALPVLKALVRTVFCMHATDVAHGNIKAETIWLRESAGAVEDFEVLFSDFGHNDQERSPCTPPEVTTDSIHDTKASDLFACGVLGYCLATSTYPWFSTKLGACKAFEFARQHGVKAFLARGLRKHPGSMSAEYEQILTALLEIDPGRRVRISKWLIK
eukprot:TRINITY_DN16551_c0_g1_i2.p1 TRINITY_DN16551_c0_g1~~TRINITY_DN16551_c0_g1_i2.p1  ORF type:complete len:386 (-),score=41.91 TRINITY_DN16551_c0_g1_i2:122-1279(-)